MIPLSYCGGFGQKALLRQRQRQFHTILALQTIIVLFIITLWPHWYQHDQPPYQRRRRYVTIEWKGRLGNVMFEYATMIGIAEMYNMTPVVTKDFPLIGLLNLSSTTLTDNLANTLGAFTTFEDFAMRASAYDRRIKTSAGHGLNLQLKGYLQSWQYFAHASDRIRKDFTFHPSVTAQAQTFHSSIQRGVIKVGVHVRRGDVLETHFSNYGYTTPGPDYYRHAMDFMRRKFGTKTVFIVCSEDPDWAQTNIQGKDVFYCPNGQRDAVDLAILASCQHMIVSVGSFGWWAAWLANGTTVFYKNWPKPASQLEYHVNKKEYFLPHWIPLE